MIQSHIFRQAFMIGVISAVFLTTARAGTVLATIDDKIAEFPGYVRNGRPVVRSVTPINPTIHSLEPGKGGSGVWEWAQPEASIGPHGPGKGGPGIWEYRVPTVTADDRNPASDAQIVLSTKRLSYNPNNFVVNPDARVVEDLSLAGR